MVYEITLFELLAFAFLCGFIGFIIGDLYRRGIENPVEVCKR